MEPPVPAPSAIVFPFKACSGGGLHHVLLGPGSCARGRTCVSLARHGYTSLSLGWSFLEALGLGSLGDFFLLFVKCYRFFSDSRITLYDALDCLPDSLQLLPREFHKTSRKLGSRRNLEFPLLYTWEMALTWCGW